MNAMDLRQALPEGFDFYHLGQVEMGSALSGGGLGINDELTGCRLVAYSLNGDLRGYVVVAFHEGLDASMYTELGNILGSKICTKLSEDGVDVMLGAPVEISQEKFFSVLSGSDLAYAQEYLHLAPEAAPSSVGNGTVSIRAFVFTYSVGGSVGNA